VWQEVNGQEKYVEEWQRKFSPIKQSEENLDLNKLYSVEDLVDRFFPKIIFQHIASRRIFSLIPFSNPLKAMKSYLSFIRRSGL
jgi:hypothetical protein